MLFCKLIRPSYLCSAPRYLISETRNLTNNYFNRVHTKYYLVTCCIIDNTAYKVCLKSNETGVIKFFINNWTANRHYPLQSSSLGKPHTAGDVASTPGSSAGILHVNVPLAGLSWPFGCCPQFQNEWWPLRWNLSYRKRKKSHGLRSGEYGGCRTTGIPFLVKNSFTEMAVWWSIVVMQHPSVRNLWLDTMNPNSESFRGPYDTTVD